MDIQGAKKLLLDEHRDRSDHGRATIDQEILLALIHEIECLAAWKPKAAGRWVECDCGAERIDAPRQCGGDWSKTVTPYGRCRIWVKG